MQEYHSIIIGGGAAGFFAAITCKEAHPNARIVLLEKSQHLLSKVKISGGGRCNVTHACFDPAVLVKNYPRGMHELRGPFSRFQPLDTIEWFKRRGVDLKTESDGRMFPTTDDSQTIIDCLVRAAKGVEIVRGQQVVKIEKQEKQFQVHLKTGEILAASMVMLATGSLPQGHELAQSLGHTIVEPVPSLFTFNIPDSPFASLAGVSVDAARVSLPEFGAAYKGPALITHWGLSGPAVLKLSAFCARELHGCGYHTVCSVDWHPETSHEELHRFLARKKESAPAKCIASDPLIPLPKNLWKCLSAQAGIAEDLRWAHLSKHQAEELIQAIKCCALKIEGRTVHKQEFVTCGGIKLSEVNFQTMESRKTSGLYFGGEILDIDGITGGFNFQAAWTLGWLAGHSMASRVPH